MSLSERKALRIFKKDFALLESRASENMYFHIWLLREGNTCIWREYGTDMENVWLRMHESSCPHSHSFAGAGAPFELILVHLERLTVYGTIIRLRTFVHPKLFLEIQIM